MNQLLLFIKEAFKPKKVVAPARTKKAVLAKSSPTQDRYDTVVREMLAKYGIKVRKWRKSSSGVARQVSYVDGTVKRSLESPYPRGPMSMAIFLHEVGHHAIGFNVYKPRCLEEYHAWAFAIREMERLELNITDGVRTRMHRSLKYAVDKASRRGLKQIPPELMPYLSVPARKAS